MQTGDARHSTVSGCDVRSMTVKSIAQYHRKDTFIPLNLKINNTKFLAITRFRVKMKRCFRQAMDSVE